MARFANIIVDIALEKLDKTFQYKVPKHMEDTISVGMEVQVPFGAGNRFIHGYVMELTDTPEYDEDKLKEIAKLLPNSISVEQHFLQLAAWMRETYGATMIQCLKTVSPIRQKVEKFQKKYVQLRVDREQAGVHLQQYKKKNAKAKVRLLEAFFQEREIPQENANGGSMQKEEIQEETATPSVLSYDLVTKKLNISLQTLRALEAEGVIAITSERVYRNPVVERQWQQKEIVLHESQREVVDAIMSDYEEEYYGTYLIHGVTGSGKTEVYIELAARIVARSKQAIVLIPEIALTYQTVMRFYRRFGQRVSILNSRMSQGERYDQFERAKKGEIDVIIGPRSALFTPFLQLGVIIIDEEHESTYKSENMPRYHAREVAIKRAEMLGASVVLGSATPSLEAYTKALQGEYGLFTLTARQGNGTLPAVEIVDLKAELAKGNKSMFSVSLYEGIKERLERKEQVMLFLNRRGFAGFVSCRECGTVIKCPHCDVSLSYHRDGRLHCHYCGYTRPMTKLCPECGSKFIGTFKAGTQQVEEAVSKLFPQARVLRMDMDTTRQKGGHEAILERFANEEGDILIGTQMIVKGHDFKNVTLMGVLAADMSLLASDYRAAERTFQLLAQAAGRAGRSEKPGKVIIQTYQPQHYAVEAAAAHDYSRFYEEEMGYRLLMGYPPAAHMMEILISASKESVGEELAMLLKEQIRSFIMEKEMECIGPAPAPIAKVRDIYRWTIYLKDETYENLVEARKRLECYMEQEDKFLAGNVQFDFNPMQT